MWRKLYEAFCGCRGAAWNENVPQVIAALSYIRHICYNTPECRTKVLAIVLHCASYKWQVLTRKNNLCNKEKRYPWFDHLLFLPFAKSEVRISVSTSGLGHNSQFISWLLIFSRFSGSREGAGPAAHHQPPAWSQSRGTHWRTLSSSAATEHPGTAPDAGWPFITVSKKKKAVVQVKLVKSFFKLFADCTRLPY